MCTYGDLMSLLLCFFIMLFALSVIMEIKWEAFVETMEARMGYSGNSPAPSQGSKPSSATSATSERSRRTAAMTGGQPTAGKAGESPTLQTIDHAGTAVKGGLIRFELGSDSLTEQAEKDLEALFPILRDSPKKIMVKGYAAPTEDEIGIFSRDVYLAHARATIVVDHLIVLGLEREFFQMSSAFSTSIPNKAILPQGITDPKLAGASVAIYLIDNTVRESKENDGETEN